MNILVISNQIPAAERRGNQIVSYFRIMYLARKHTVQIVCFGDINKPDDKEAKQTLEKAGIIIHLVKWKPLIAFYQILKAIPNSKIPFQCALFQSKELQKVIEDVQIRFTPDILYFVMIRITLNNINHERPTFIDMVDSMGLNFSRRTSTKNILMRWFFTMEFKRVSAFEQNLARQSTHSFVVSKIDKAAIGADNMTVIPLGIDMRRFRKENTIIKENIITFTGNMFYRPNVDAALWFINNCWKEIKSNIPDARLIIVGSSPPQNLIAISKQDDSIQVTGRVPSIAAVLNTAKVSIAPMQSGSGMQFKILEAMACGVPVVANSLGLGDISATDKNNILIADTPKAFTEAVLHLLTSKELAKKIGDAGLKYVHANHDWNVLNKRFAETCELE